MLLSHVKFFGLGVLGWWHTYQIVSDSLYASYLLFATERRIHGFMTYAI